MNGLTATRLLAIWERGAGLPPVQRALELLAAAYPDEDASRLAGLSIGQRDALLLSLQAQTYGARLNCLADCPACGERVEINLDAGELTSSPGALAQAEPFSFTEDGYQVSFRLPNSQDLLALAAGLQPDRRRGLAERCILAVLRAGDPVAPAALPEPLIETLGRRMTAADPLADIWFDVTCPVCKHHWQAPFDIVSYLWGEIDAWAYRTLKEVHKLASAYGWNEAEILSLSAWRRQFYLSLI